MSKLPKHATDNRSRQLNPEHPAYESSRANPAPAHAPPQPPPAPAKQDQKEHGK